MQETRIKINGITSVQDARLSLAAGADYLGLDFSCGTRRIDVPTAKAIREALPTAMLVGIFCDTPIGEIVSIGRSCGLNMIQLRGNESPEFCTALLARLPLAVIKTFGVDDLAGVERTPLIDVVDARIALHTSKTPQASFDLEGVDLRHGGEAGGRLVDLDVVFRGDLR